MTDEEMAVEYAEEKVSNLDECRTKDLMRSVCKDGFLAGLKVGKPQWHDINDTEPSKEQLGKQLLIRMKSVIGDIDYDYLVYKYSGESITDVPDVIAWCEIPEFK